MRIIIKIIIGIEIKIVWYQNCRNKVLQREIIDRNNTEHRNTEITHQMTEIIKDMCNKTVTLITWS